MSEAQVASTEEVEIGGDEFVPVTKEALSCLLACAVIVHDLILRSWEDRENSNVSILTAADAYGLQFERSPTDEEIADGADPDDTMLELSPVLVGLLQGFCDGMADRAVEDANSTDHDDPGVVAAVGAV